MEKATIDGIAIGNRALRKKEGHFKTEWIEFIVNETYIRLMAEFPNDYRHIDGSEIKPNGWKAGNVKCDICSHKWVAVYPADAFALACPNCKQTAYFDEQ